MLCMLLASSCTQEKSKTNRKISSVGAFQPSVEQGEIWGDEEVASMNRVAEIFHDTLIEATGDDKIMRRDAHPKHHGCVSSSLQIDNHRLPSDLRVGLFAENKKYNAVVRLSNGDPDFRKADGEKDVRGFAIKLYDVPYSNYLQEIGFDEEEHIHDIVMMNADNFFIPNPKAYEKFMKSTQGRWGVFSYLVFHWGTLKNVLKARVQVSNPLDIDYSTATPYKLGSMSMKMKFKSCRAKRDSIPKEASHNYLGERLEKTLKTEEGCFDMYVQPNRDRKKNDIENAMAAWDEKESPFIKVGKLSIAKQEGFRTAEAMKSCEDLTFNPWRAPSENRPMGGVNRIRLEVYLNQSKLRHEYNGVN